MNNSPQNLEITLKRSLIGVPLKVKKVALAIGLSKPNQKVLRINHPTIQGMIFKIQHLIDVKTV
ncbi:MAG: 50S ribosomal protein L30 [Leptospirillum sp.]|jgi:large subunit ribosomal protein L30